MLSRCHGDKMVNMIMVKNYERVESVLGLSNLRLNSLEKLEQKCPKILSLIHNYRTELSLQNFID